MNFIDIILERGFSSPEKMTDMKTLHALCDLEKNGPQTAYIGFDCTAKSLHVGSLLQIMLLRWWQKCGHRPIVLLGGGTTKIGDPSGKDESRPPLTDAQIRENQSSLDKVFSKFLNFGSGPSDAITVNNDEWLRNLNYMEFLREYGRHFSINRMLTMDSVKLRLEREQTLSFLEFNYMILQAYDFVELNRRHACRVQMGGSDQWGNIVNGVELNRRIHPNPKPKLEGVEPGGRGANLKAEREITEVLAHEATHTLFGITSPLLTTSSGAKMGKTASGAVWLNADMLSPYDYWQYWRNTEDGDVIRFLKLFTELPLEQIAEYESWLGSSKINDAKVILATEATAMLHGREAAERAQKTAAETFSGSGVSSDLPEITITNVGASIIELLVTAEFAASNGEARRLIQGNGISINDVKVTDEKQCLKPADFAQGFAKLSKGKKQRVLVKIGTIEGT